MWTRWKVCDACQKAQAATETESGFFLCEECEAVVVIAFQEFELPSASQIGNEGVASVPAPQFHHGRSSIRPPPELARG